MAQDSCKCPGIELRELLDAELERPVMSSNARMTPLRRFSCALLLVCVVLALGDAPYVDEFFDDLNTASAESGDLAVTIAQHGAVPNPSKHTPQSSSICQNLLNLPAASSEIHLVAVPDGTVGFPTTAGIPFSSADPERIDRPPTSLLA